MLSIFLTHQWKGFWRSRNKAGSIAAQVMLFFFMLYFLGIAVYLGVQMRSIIEQFFPGRPEIAVFNGFILYYFLLDLGMRFQLQELPTLSVIPYLPLNIAKREIVKFLNIKAIINFFNILPIFIFLPFCIMNIGAKYGAVTCILFILGIFALSFFNNFLILYIKRKSINNLGYFIGIIILVAGLAALDYFNIISIRKASETVFGKILEYPALALVFVALAAGIFIRNSRYLLSNLYTEELTAGAVAKVSTDYPFLNRFGKAGALAALELKLILRHKRPRGSVMMGFAFLFYGFIFYKAPLIENNEFGKLLFAAIFMTGISILTYGQFMFAWQSTHFDGLMSSKISLKEFIKAKFLLFTISSTVISILASFYGLISWKLLLLHLAAYVYNLGFGTVVVLFFATINYKRMDITKSASMNWQGVGATQYILSIPYILVPILLYVPFGMADIPYWGLFAVGMLGLVMLLSRNFWVNYITNRLIRNKYKIAEGFRE